MNVEDEVLEGGEQSTGSWMGEREGVEASFYKNFVGFSEAVAHGV